MLLGLGGLADALGDARHQRLGVEVPLLAAGADEAVAGAAGIARHHGAGGGDIDRDLLVGPVVDRGLLGLVVLALEGDALLAPQLADQGHRLAHAGEALLELGPRRAGRRHLVQPLAGADAQDHAARAHRAQRAEGLRHDRRVIAEGRRQHAGAHDQLRGPRAERAQPDQRGRRVAVDMLPRLEVVADERRVEADLLGHDSEIEQLRGRELFGRRLVSELEHGGVPYPDERRFSTWRQRSTQRCQACLLGARLSRAAHPPIAISHERLWRAALPASPDVAKAVYRTTAPAV